MRGVGCVGCVWGTGNFKTEETIKSIITTTLMVSNISMSLFVQLIL